MLRRRRQNPTFAYVTLAGVLMSSMATGCGNTGEESRPGWMGGASNYGGAHSMISLGRCSGDESEERECTVYLEQQSGVTSCFYGIQYCDDGVWSDCIDREHDPRVR